ncbi:MAG TPA: DUF424 family protein [Candidatus Bilamarchaeaceae archaeon]|nr:DUF424 family protein [Candidatus Bilamarchaeaceae archaeon]
MYLKVHETRQGRIVAACDKALVGRVLREGKKILDLKTYKNFYVGQSAKEADVQQALKSFSSANLVGKKATQIAIEMGLAEETQVLYIGGIPYLQMYKI